MEETHIPDFAKSKDILLFDYTKKDKLEFDEPIGKDGRLADGRPVDGRLIKFLYYISTGDRIWYKKFDKEKGCYSNGEYTNFSTLHDRLVNGELNLVCPLDNIIYVFGEIAKKCKEKGIEHAIKSGLVSYGKSGHFSCRKDKGNKKELLPSIVGCVGRCRACINMINDIGKESTFGFDIKRVCEVIQIKYKSSPPLFHKTVCEIRVSDVTMKFSTFLKNFMKEYFPKNINKFDEVLKEFFRKFNDEELERRMENKTMVSDDISSMRL